MTRVATIAVVLRLVWWFATLVAGVLLAFVLAAASVTIHRGIPQDVGRCGDGRPCLAQLPAAGWPFAFLYDNPGTSVVGSLGPEDDFQPRWYLADAAVFAVVPVLGVATLALFTRRKPLRLNGRGTWSSVNRRRTVGPIDNAHLVGHYRSVRRN